MSLWGILLWMLVGGIIGAFLMMKYADKHYCNGIWTKEKQVRLAELEVEITHYRKLSTRNELEVDDLITSRVKSLGEFE